MTKGEALQELDRTLKNTGIKDETAAGIKVLVELIFSYRDVSKAVIQVLLADKPGQGTRSSAVEQYLSQHDNG